MNVYDMNAESGRKWVWFFTLDGVALPESKDSRAFFEAQPRVRIDRNTEATPRDSQALFGDYSNVGYTSYPCWSARAKQVLGSHVDRLGQWLALECDEAPYWLFNVTNVVDALDEKRSELAHFSSGRIMAIDRFVFRPERLRGQLVFDVPQCTGSYKLVTQDFVDLVRKHDLTGFNFKPVWTEESASTRAA